VSEDQIHGFGIRCPYCSGEQIFDENPAKYAFKSFEDFKKIWEEINNTHESTDSIIHHEKLIRCNSKPWQCPRSFEAFIFDNEKEALKSLAFVEEKVATWSINRDFRLYKTDMKTRWDHANEPKYYGIMFCTQLVPRPRDILLDHLIDRELLKRMIVGVSCEIGLPVTIYSAHIFKDGDDPVWMPIENYSPNYRLIPEKYNVFCETLRETIVHKLKEDLKQIKTQYQQCEFFNKENESCANQTGKAPCCENPEVWNDCPKYIYSRAKICPCYRSDLEIIQKGITLKDWKKTRDGIFYRHDTCHAGFLETCLPLIVHDNLVAAVFTGQVYLHEAKVETQELNIDLLRRLNEEEKKDSKEQKMYSSGKNII